MSRAQSASRFGDAEGAVVPINLPDISSSTLGLAGIDLRTFAHAETAIGTCDSALTVVLTDRAQLGAQLVSLDQQAQLNNVASMNLESAASNIEDLNVPQEAATYTRL